MSAKELVLRPASLEDCAALLHIEQATCALPWSAGHFRSILQNTSNTYTTQILLEDNTPIAYFIGMLGVEESHLLNIAVHPLHQGKGYARLLLEHLKTWSLAGGARAIWLEVRESNTRAYQLYRQQGFVDVALRKNYYPTTEGGREHAHILRLDL